MHDEKAPKSLTNSEREAICDREQEWEEMNLAFAGIRLADKRNEREAREDKAKKKPKPKPRVAVKKAEVVVTNPFTCFPLFPAEIRLLIWKHALPDSRVLRVSVDPISRVLTTIVSNPVILHVNHQARAVALEHYEPIALIDKRFPIVYINYARDILYLNSDEELRKVSWVSTRLPPTQRAKVRSVALVFTDVDMVMPVVTLFPNRQMLYMVQADDRDPHKGRNDQLYLKKIGEAGARTVSDIGKEEIEFFEKKWERKRVTHPSWKAPVVEFVSLECRGAKPPARMLKWHE